MILGTMRPDASPEVRPFGSLARVNGNWRTKTVTKRRRKWMRMGLQKTSSTLRTQRHHLSRRRKLVRRRIRSAKQINYAIPPPIEKMARPPKAASRPNKGKARGPGWSANGTELSRYMGMPGPMDDSVSMHTFLSSCDVNLHIGLGLSNTDASETL